jgi:hypothetical protein
MGIEFRGFASDTSSGLGAYLGIGGARDGVSQRLGISDSKAEGNLLAWNSEGNKFELSPPRDNNTWYTYRLIPDLQNNIVRISRNGRSWTIPEPRDDPLETSQWLFLVQRAGGAEATVTASMTI